MKLLTLNFLTCAIKSCKTQPSSFPLHPRDASLEIVESELNLPFLKNILPRLMWEELRVIASELGLPELPATAPTRDDLVVGGEKSPTTQPPQREAPETDAVAEAEEAEAAQEEEAEEQPTQTARDLHRLLLETCVQEGKLVCGCCGHEYKVLEGVANFLLPGHLV